jgi:hypothetical protein
LLIIGDHPSRVFDHVPLPPLKPIAELPKMLLQMNKEHQTLLQMTMNQHNNNVQPAFCSILSSWTILQASR